MRKLEEIIVHCSATPATMDIGAAEIRQWHVGQDWDDIGYHFVIRRNGTIEDGRPVEEVGAHCIGRNHNSIGICLVGGRAQTSQAGELNYTKEQLQTLRLLVDTLRKEYTSISKLSSHCQYARKWCPGFLAEEWYRTGKLGS